MTLTQRLRRLFGSIVVLILLTGCAPVQRAELQSVTLILTNGTIIDGTGAEPTLDGLVAIKGDRIVAVGPADDFKIPKDVVVVDVAGGTILPGIINAHAHQVMMPGTRQILFLHDGVTSVCDMMIPIASMHYLDEKGAASGPAARGFQAGPIITAPGGYPGVLFGSIFSYEIRGEQEAESAVLHLFEQGADYIKVALEPGIYGDPWPVLTLEELGTTVGTAHAQGLLVRAHTNNAMLEIALQAGVDVMEHVPMPSFAPQDLEPMLDESGIFHIPPELKEQLERMVAQGMVLVPTLDVIVNDDYLPEGVLSGGDVVSQAVLDLVRFFHKAGGTIALGNDYGNAGVKPGMPLREMELLLAVGLTPMEVIEAGTRHAAYVCGHGDALGTLEPGKLADLVVVQGNPLDDIGAMDAVLFVVKDGEIVALPE